MSETPSLQLQKTYYGTVNESFARRIGLMVTTFNFMCLECKTGYKNNENYVYAFIKNNLDLSAK